MHVVVKEKLFLLSRARAYSRRFRYILAEALDVNPQCSSEAGLYDFFVISQGRDVGKLRGVDLPDIPTLESRA